MRSQIQEKVISLLFERNGAEADCDYAQIASRFVTTSQVNAFKILSLNLDQVKLALEFIQNSQVNALEILGAAHANEALQFVKPTQVIALMALWPGDNAIETALSITSEEQLDNIPEITALFGIEDYAGPTPAEVEDVVINILSSGPPQAHLDAFV